MTCPGSPTVAQSGATDRWKRIQCGARHHNTGGRTTSHAGKGSRDGRTARNCAIRSVKLKRSKDYVRIKREGQPDWIKQLNRLPEDAFERVSTE
jgi:hypothetical protein